MIEFVDVYNNILHTKGEQVAFADGTESITYNELDELSAKIYSCLKSQGIGREDFVQIVLTRGINVPVAVMGVIKAGAAFVLLEDTYPRDRIEFIYKDCNCKLRIDNKLFDEMIGSDKAKSGFEDADYHDACYAVYTSGSTGNPKGVLHEYGNIRQTYESFRTDYDNDITNAAIFAPFYFVAGVIELFRCITRGRTAYIIPHDMMRDFVAVKKYIIDNNIEEIFLPPSYLKIYSNPAPCLKVIYTGSEPANGLYFNGNPKLINFYAMSESGFVVLQAELDKAYDVAPVGITYLNEIEERIIDDDGNVVKGEGQGELCFVNDYIRGYINLDDQTKETWRDGLYHTGDCARRDADGNYYIVGRFDDMIKINGNRVEPVEIERQIKKLTGLSQVVCKGFKINNRTFICAYFLESEAISLNIYKNKELDIDISELSETLPDYMMPTYYVALKSFPLLYNGKIAKKKLMPPSTNDNREDYVAPTSDLEKQICDIFTEVLKLDSVGITDDFYQIGGDSMSSIVMAAKFSEAGLFIDAKAIYDNRTPGKLASFYENNKDKLLNGHHIFDNANAFNEPNYSGAVFLRPTKQGEGGIFKYHMTFKIDEEILHKAHQTVIDKYPFFNFSYEEREGKLYYIALDKVAKPRPFSDYSKIDRGGLPLIELFFENNSIIITYYHVLTDGEGFFFFAKELLHEYLILSGRSKTKMPVRDFDYTYDVLSKQLETDGKCPKLDMPRPFRLPEYNSDKDVLTAYKITLKRSDWLEYVNAFISDHDLEGIRRLRGIGSEDAFVAGYVMLKSFAKLHSDAAEPFLCRFPINMRSALGRENTLRNCAMPQAFYVASASEISDDGDVFNKAFTRILKMTSTEYLAQRINRLIALRTEPNVKSEPDPVISYIREATVLATNLGNIAYNEDAKYLNDFSINFVPTCATSIQSCILGDEQVLIINQRFDTDVYVDRLIEELSCNDTYEVTINRIV